MSDSLFTKIIKGEIPSHKVYEDDKTFAFMDIHPKRPGHVVIISKEQIDHVWDLPDQDYQALMETSKKIANRVREVLKPKRVAMHIEGLGVPHAHVHIFPFATSDEFHARQDMSKDPDHEALAEMAKRLSL